MPQSAPSSSPRSSKSLKLLHNLLTDSTVPQISLMTLNGLKSPFLSSFRPKTGQLMSQILTEIVAIVASRIFSGSDQLWEELIDYVYVSITDSNVTQEVQEMVFRIQGSNVSLTHFLSLKRNPNFLSLNIFFRFLSLGFVWFWAFNGVRLWLDLRDCQGSRAKKQERGGTMTLAEKELEAQLTEAGNQLLESPSSVPDLLDVLDVSPNFSSNCWVFFFFSYCEVFAS